MDHKEAEATQHQVALLAGLAKDLPLEEFHHYLVTKAPGFVSAELLGLVDAARTFRARAIECLTGELEEQSHGSLEAAVASLTNGAVGHG